MISKKIVAVGLSVVLSTLLFGEVKPKKQTVEVKSTEQPKSEVIKKDPNEFEVSKSDVMPKITSSLVRDNAKETVYDPTTKLMWQDNSEVKSNARDWRSAIEYCNTLSFGGYNDWRLPDINELRSIVDFTKSSPAIKSGIINVSSYSRYLSSSLHAAWKFGAPWLVHFGYGGDDTSSNNGYDPLVRCVRDSK